MMALPIAMLARGRGPVLGRADAGGAPERPDSALGTWGLGGCCCGALAIGALWPTNTWDYPTYGLVAAGAHRWWGNGSGTGGLELALAGYTSPCRGLLLLVLSLAALPALPRQLRQPYASFEPVTRATRTALGLSDGPRDLPVRHRQLGAGGLSGAPCGAVR